MEKCCLRIRFCKSSSVVVLRLRQPAFLCIDDKSNSLQIYTFSHLIRLSNCRKRRCVCEAHGNKYCLKHHAKSRQLRLQITVFYRFIIHVDIFLPKYRQDFGTQQKSLTSVV
ncbi:hypothetical protein EGR_03960 [Echinococcus granulosus]|uniref:Uncharacterized protein n=1 Tax=Echinococcus granulosus TaxID=6210 RepID=W6URY6_ECHGR|nr:hypothetical protein EGR_03960 [Echinococcus granulosus]EUB61112.1 hypothetical protein EGR_03960 [Echinococcus granulosus]